MASIRWFEKGQMTFAHDKDSNGIITPDEILNPQQLKALVEKRAGVGGSLTQTNPGDFMGVYFQQQDGSWWHADDVVVHSMGRASEDGWSSFIANKMTLNADGSGRIVQSPVDLSPAPKQKPWWKFW